MRYCPPSSHRLAAQCHAFVRRTLPPVMLNGLRYNLSKALQIAIFQYGMLYVLDHVRRALVDIH